MTMTDHAKEPSGDPRSSAAKTDAAEEELQRILRTTPKINVFSRMLGTKKNKTVDSKSWTARFLLLSMIIWLAYYSFFRDTEDTRLNEFLGDSIKGTTDFREDLEDKVNADNPAPAEPAAEADKQTPPPTVPY